MEAILLGVAAAIVYGSADFAGGLATKRTGVFSVVLYSQALGALPMVALLPLFSGDNAGEALLWGFGAGAEGGLGVVLLYRGLAIGRMNVVAPITAVNAAVLPVFVGLVTGERPSAVALVGVVAALTAVALISAGAEEDVTGEAAPARAGVLYGMGAGIGFGLFFIFLAHAPDGSGLWPLIGARISALVLVGAIAVVMRAQVKPSRGTLGMVALAGGLDVIANVLYLLASRVGLLSLVAVLTSMYPASTVLLARIVLKERMNRWQVLGLLLAAVGVGLIAGG